MLNSTMLDKLNKCLHILEPDNVEYELQLLNNNLRGLSYDALRKINAIVEMIKKGAR